MNPVMPPEHENRAPVMPSQESRVDIKVGDCREILRTLGEGSVQCCVTSPPYFGLRDYGVAGQIGLEQTPDAYVAELVSVFREVRRVLADDGTLWLNLGDSYANDAKWGGYSGGRHAKALHGESGIGRARRRTGIPPKSLLLMPARVALALQADGWVVRSEIIWAKPHGMPESVADRPTKSHETVYLIAKQPAYYIDMAAIAEPVAASSAARLAQDVERQTGSTRANGGTRPGRPMKAKPGKRAFLTQTGGVASSGLGVSPTETRNRRSVWTVASQPFSGAHFATFPPKLVEPCILAGSRRGDTILDPFGGAGTTGLVASRLGRSALLIELNPEYAELARKRIHDDAPLFANGEVA